MAPAASLTKSRRFMVGRVSHRASTSMQFFNQTSSGAHLSKTVAALAAECQHVTGSLSKPRGTQ